MRLNENNLNVVRSPSNLLELFLVNNALALRGFGGVLPWAQRVYVEERAWFDQAEFNEMLALAQVTPGPNVVNLSIAVGDRFFGVRGAVVSFLGMILIPLVIVLTLASIYRASGDNPWVRAALNGMTPVAAGLILLMAMKMAINLWQQHGRLFGSIWLSISVLVLFSAVFAKISVGLIVLVAAPLCVALAWYLRPARSGVGQVQEQSQIEGPK